MRGLRFSSLTTLTRCVKYQVYQSF